MYRKRDKRRSWNVSSVFLRLLGQYALLCLLIAVSFGFALYKPESFFTINNFRGIFVNQIVVLFAAIGLILPLIVGELDLSVGYVVGFAQACVVGLMSYQDLSPFAAITITVVACAVIGTVNGLLVVRVGISALIATLATGNILFGVVLWYTKGEVLFSNIPKAFLALTQNTLLYIPLSILYGLLLVIIFEIFLGYFPAGRRMYAVGGNRRAALLTGISVERFVVAAFVVSAIVSGLGGVIIASRLASAEPELGPSFLLPAFASAFLGATTIRPGRYNAVGTMVAVYLIAVIVAGLQQIGVPYWAEYIVYGLSLVGGVAMSRHLTKMRLDRARLDQLKAFDESRESLEH
jgi:ribose transport system permease protein